MPKEPAKPSTVNPFELGPYVQVAAFCERVLREADGVVSLIRIVDVINHVSHGPNAPTTMPTVRYPLTLVVILKSGRAKGREELTIVPELPSGETLQQQSLSVLFEGEGKGVNVIAPMDIPYTLEGLYWFHIKLGTDVLTRLPLEVRYSRFVTGSTRSPTA